jgi:hypothetical protein
MLTDVIGILLDVVALPGLLLGSIVAGSVLWFGGLRDPFLLTASAVVFGGIPGMLLEARFLGHGKRRKTKPN